jgi:hypothetical protein
MLRFLATVLVCCGFAAAQSPLAPPFGLRWGDSPETFLSWAEKHSLDITITLPAAERGLRILQASSAKGPLPGSTASALEGRFLKGRLFEITEHHADASLPTELFEARFEETRKRLTHEHGPLLANRLERKVEDQIVTSARAFHREPVKGLMLMLVYTELEDLLRKSKSSRYSIIYRNENLRKEMMVLGENDKQP